MISRLPLLSFVTGLMVFSLASCSVCKPNGDGKGFFGKSRSGAGSQSRDIRPWNSAKRQRVRTTAYSHRENEPGAYGRKNAIGTKLRYGLTRSAAADWSQYPVGTQFRISGQPYLYEIDDFGSALVGTNTIDLFKPSLRLMKEWGVRTVDIKIVKWGSFEESAAILSKRTRYPHVREMYRCIQSRPKR